MTRRSRAVLGTMALMGTVLMGTVSITPAVAAEATTVTITVVNEAGQPIPSITVTAIGPEKAQGSTSSSPTYYVELGDTNADGQIVRSRGNYPFNRLSGGAWEFGYRDNDRARIAAKNAYATTRVRPVELTSGTDTAVSATLKIGNTLTGVFTAPSGKVLKGLDIEAIDDDGRIGYSATTSRKTGAFVLSGIAPQRYDLFGYRDAYYHDPADFPWFAHRGFRFTGYGQEQSITVKNFQVNCDTAVRVSSRASGVARVYSSADASGFGILKPGGKVTIFRNGKKLRTLSFTSHHKSVTFTHQPRGKQTYRVAYTGGDCATWSISKKLTVKK